jgi:hypothetical protein
MNRNEFDDLAIRAVRDDGPTSEHVWSKVRPRSKVSWLPTWPELAFTAAAGGMALIVLSVQQPVVPMPTSQAYVEHKQPTPFDDSFVAVNRLAGVNPAMLDDVTSTPK